MTPPAELKQQLLAHCLWMADLDPEYAIWAAGDYERQMPDLLANLQRKVQQHVRRKEAAHADAIATK